MSAEKRVRIRRLAMIALVSTASATASATLCLQQYLHDCEDWYVQPPDGCPDDVSSTSVSYRTQVPIAEYPGVGWSESTPMSCTADIQKKVPGPEGGCVNGELITQASLPGGSQGSGAPCEFED